MKLKTMVLKEMGGSAWVYFNRPERLNAFTPDSLEDLKKLVRHFRNNEKIRSIAFSGKGKSFSVGIDLKEVGKIPIKDAKKFVRGSVKAMFELQQLDKVIVAAVNGYALGGGAEFMLLADYRIAAKNAKIGFPEIDLGYSVSSSILKLANEVGMLKAKELLFTGKQITAKEAAEIGLVNEVVGKGELEKRVNGFLREINKKPVKPIKGMKRLMNEYSTRELKKAIGKEVKLFEECFHF